MSKQYNSYLRSDHWKEHRLECIARSGKNKYREDRCQICYQPPENGIFNVHHLTYERLGHEHKKDTKPFCQNCHFLFHLYAKHYGIHPNDKKKNVKLWLALRASRKCSYKKVVQDFTKEEREYLVALRLARFGIFPIKKRPTVILVKGGRRLLNTPDTYTRCFNSLDAL